MLRCVLSATRQMGRTFLELGNITMLFTDTTLSTWQYHQSSGIQSGLLCFLLTFHAVSQSIAV